MAMPSVRQSPESSTTTNEALAVIRTADLRRRRCSAPASSAAVSAAFAPLAERCVPRSASAASEAATGEFALPLPLVLAADPRLFVGALGASFGGGFGVLCAGASAYPPGSSRDGRDTVVALFFGGGLSAAGRAFAPGAPRFSCLLGAGIAAGAISLAAAAALAAALAAAASGGLRLCWARAEPCQWVPFGGSFGSYFGG